jgi:hypothetical protein
MFNDEPTPYINGVPPEEVEDQAYQNMSQSDSLENIGYQQPMISNQSAHNDVVVEDILQKTSVGDINDYYANPLSASVTQQKIKQQVETPIITKIDPLEQYNINEQQNVYASYSYPTIKNINNSQFSTIGENNVNNVYASVQPINKAFNTSQIINDNNIYTSVQPLNDNIDNTEQIITHYPQYVNGEQNIITNTTTLPEITTTTIINDYQSPNVLSDTSFAPNTNGLLQSHAQVIPIDEERMKNPQVAKMVRESQQHVNNYLSKSKNKNFDQEYINKENKDLNKSRTKIPNKYKNSYNQNGRGYMNQKNLNDIKNFSPDFWKNFYTNDDESFFEPPENNNNIIQDQMIQNKMKNETYFGEINDQREKHGFGKLVTPEMERIGNWRNDEFTGWGREIRKNGEIYEGKFVNGKLNGKGIYKNGSIFYVGNFINYVKDGKGELFTNNNHYVGNFKKNKMHGNGRIEIYKKGVYEGQFNNGEISGYGIFKFNNGDYYEGEIKDGEMNGYGKLTQNNGKILEGYFANGEYKGENNVNEMYTYQDEY